MSSARLPNLPFATAAAVALALPQAALGQGGRTVMADAFTPKSNRAMETDDFFALMRAGCVEGLARIDFDVKLRPSGPGRSGWPRPRCASSSIATRGSPGSSAARPRSAG